MLLPNKKSDTYDSAFFKLQQLIDHSPKLAQQVGQQPLHKPLVIFSNPGVHESGCPGSHQVSRGCYRSCHQSQPIEEGQEDGDAGQVEVVPQELQDSKHERVLVWQLGHSLKFTFC